MADYPTTIKDLAKFDPCEGLELRGNTARMASRERIGYDVPALARLLNVDDGTVYALESGVLDTTTDVSGNVAKRPAIDCTERVLALIDAYARFIRAAEVLPQRAVPVPFDETNVQIEVGEADANTVTSLRKALRGHATSSAGRNLSVKQRQQSLQTYSISVASLAAAINCNERNTWEWLTGVSSPPLSNEAESYYRALDYLARGEPVSWSTSKAATSGNGLY